jgi:signal transduction histidine kinase
MHQNRLFNRTRLQLAGVYALVIGLILGAGGLAIHQIMVQVFWRTLDEEMVTLSGTLHDSLEGVLQQPGVMDPRVENFLPGLCLPQEPCFNQPFHQPSHKPDVSHRHTLGLVEQQGYYVRFLSPSGQVVATVGRQPPGLAIAPQGGHMRELQDQQGVRYHQLSVPLKTTTLQPWGYMQIGRSIQEYDDFLGGLRLILFVGLPLLMLCVAAASWWVAGLAMRPIHRAYEQMQQFTADAAHELRTPLAATRASVEASLLLETLPEAEARNTLHIVQRQILRLSQLTQDLLFLARADRQRSALPRKLVSLQELVMDLEEELQPLVIAQDIHLKIEMNEQQPIHVMGDEERLYRLFSNLITNAIQYTPKAGQVTVTVTREERHAIVRVQDTGIGIAAAEQKRIFNRFYRVNSDRSRATGGAGLGLAISKAIVQAHKGSIQVQSQLDRGSIFTVRLPLKAATLDLPTSGTA